MDALTPWLAPALGCSCRPGRLRAGVQSRCAVGRHGNRRGRRPGGTPGGDRGSGNPLPNRARGLAELHAGRPAVAAADRRGRAAARRRGRRDRGGHEPGHGPGRVGLVDGSGGGRAGTNAGRAPGRRVPRTGHGSVAELQPDAVDAAGASHERCLGAVGPGDDGGNGARQRCAGQPPRWRGRLRSADRQALRLDAAGRVRDVGGTAETTGWATASGCSTGRA